LVALIQIGKGRQPSLIWNKHKMNKILFTIIAVCLPLYGANPRPVFAQNGMVVSSSVWASKAGVDMLKKGGNAVDAAVSTGFVLAVTLPQAGNIGGGGFMVAHLEDGSTFTLDYREMAPQAAHRDMFLDDTGAVDRERAMYSHLSSAVPGSVDGLLKVMEDHGSGKISRQQAIKPAILLAEKGFPITRRYAGILNAKRDFFARDDGASAIFIKKNGKPWKAGDVLIQRDLAKTLKRIAKYGRDGFYSGKVADHIVNEMKEGGGIISYDDLSSYTSKYRQPITAKYREYDIISMGPPSSGGALLIHMLNMTEQFSLDSLGWNSSDYIHVLTEIERRAYADRAEHMADMDFWKVPLAMFGSQAYAKVRASTIDMEKATPSSDIFAGDPLPYESPETTHYSVMDNYGNAVAVTTTINTSFGSGIVVEGAGFVLNNEMDDFSAKPGSPNYFGLLGKESNAIEPMKRPLSSMTPTILLKDEKPFMVVGTPGGGKIITNVFQTILNRIVFGMDIQTAVSVPRLHSQWLPNVIFSEPLGMPKDVERNLEQKGHTISVIETWGQTNAITADSIGLLGGADPRGENSAIGY
jgi:gamma-glutamyltranspeptidase/glutathione hydrolase